MLADSLPPPLRDSLYAFVGFPVVAADELSRAGRRLSGELGGRVEQVLDRLQEQLPDPARDAVGRTRTQLRTLVPSRN